MSSRKNSLRVFALGKFGFGSFSIAIFAVLAILIVPGFLPPVFAATPSAITKTTSTVVAGYAIASPSASISFVQGNWAVPKPTCTAGETAAVVYLVSIVKDGAGLVFGCANGTPSYVPGYTLNGVQSLLPSTDTVSTGDKMSVTVTASSSHLIKITFKDTTKSWTFTKSATDSGNTENAAAWALGHSGSSSTMPNFGSLKTSNNMVTIGGTKGSLSSFSSTYPIVESNLVNSHGKVIGTTSSLSGSGSSFTITG